MNNLKPKYDIYTFKDLKRAYGKGYRAGRLYDAVGKAMKKAMNDWHKHEQTGFEGIAQGIEVHKPDCPCERCRQTETE